LQIQESYVFWKSTMPFILSRNFLRSADLGLASSLVYRVVTRKSFNDDDENVECIQEARRDGKEDFLSAWLRVASCKHGSSVRLGQTMLNLASDDIKNLVRRILPPRLMRPLRVSHQLDPGAGWLYLKLQVLRLLGIRKDRLSMIPCAVSSVLFVCHGNIIRSPLAAALLHEQLSNLDRNGIHVSSAGLHAKPGKSADPRAIIAARERGVSLEDHRAQSLNIDLVRHADLIFVMDHVNEAQLLIRYPEARSKLFLLSIEGANREQASVEIADPDAGHLYDVRQCCETIQSRLSDLVSLLIRSNSIQKLPQGGEG